ncbi:isoaspartyl peptidase/L-asparaginase [Geitlerinema sp. PCC 9228]|uniref:isoaspartyl peptidase/L-asparaginase n=1 Tax=Geitlerinema sp. PCC 9228 TaxID=111611 RepID=UPI0011149A8D
MMTKVQPKLILHGGAGSSLQSKGGIDAVRQSLQKAIAQVYNLLTDGVSAKEAVVQGCRILEDDPIFNAGTGSVLQSDGQIRMSAGFMDGTRQSFSGVINVSRIQHPIDLAQKLQQERDRVLSDYGAQELAREQQLPVYDPSTEKRLQEWLQDRKGAFQRSMADVVAESAGRGTIGVVAFDENGNLAAGTSTGGKGFERVGRVSDSAMPAGNYANSEAAVSCTGIGEDIIDECLAARIAIRVSDGWSLPEAFGRSFAEAESRQRDLGAIGIDQNGHIAWGKTSDVILAGFHNGDRMGDCLEAASGTVVDRII